MPMEPHNDVSKLRIKIGNLRSILRRNCKGIKQKSLHEIAVMSRDKGTGRPEEIAVFRHDQEAEAIEFYRNYITKRLKESLVQLKKQSPDDLWLKGLEGDLL